MIWSLIFSMLVFSSVSFAQITNESELGFASANGNTKTKSYNIKQLNSYTFDKNVLSFKSRYLNASSNGEETARIFSAGLRYDRELSLKTKAFAGETYETDKFAGIRARYITDAGGKYSYIETEETKFFSELGYRFMKENRFEGSSINSSYIRFYNEWENKWNKNFTTRYWLELLPNLSNSKDYQANTEISLSAILTEMFSMKSSFLIRYDHAPAPGVEYKSDTLFSTALVAKF